MSSGPENVGKLALLITAGVILAFGVSVIALRGKTRSVLIFILSSFFWLWAAPALFWTVVGALRHSHEADEWLFVAIMVSIAAGMTWLGIRLWPQRTSRAD